MNRIFYILVLALVVLSSCSVSVPEEAILLNESAQVLPDNGGATLPPNIAPLNFEVLNPADDYVVTLQAGEESITLQGPTIDIPVADWQHLLQQAKDDTLHTIIYIRKDGRWYQFPTIDNPVAQDEVDPYISYRIIQPGYIEYEDITIRQRDVTNWDEQIIYDNSEFGAANDNQGQCVNCHNYQNYNAQGCMQLHLREHLGGTLITQGNQMTKVNLKTDSTLSAGTYPAWHPTLPLIAYSANSTGQAFHTSDPQKVEVIDYGSDLVLYDIPANKLYSIETPGEAHALTQTGRTPDVYETFPSWSPDGKTLYYCAAQHIQRTDNIDAELHQSYDSLHYDIYCRPFDLQQHTFGPQSPVVQPSLEGRSAALPRISPDGRYLLYSEADYGQFHIWHRSADLVLIDLQTDTRIDLSTLNSEDTESYHSWSSNGRWILFSSRRIDGSYTRLYMAYFDRQGRVHRPLLLPQRDPRYYEQLFRSYNVPEWMTAPAAASHQDLKQAAKGPARQAQYVGNAVIE